MALGFVLVPLHCPLEMHILMVLLQDALTCVSLRALGAAGLASPSFQGSLEGPLERTREFLFLLYASHFILSEVLIVSSPLWQYYNNLK